MTECTILHGVGSLEVFSIKMDTGGAILKIID